MGIEKAEIKMEVAHELGATFDDALEQAEREIHKYDGAKTALSGAANAVEELILHVKKDLEEEDIDEAQAMLVRKWLRRATETVRNLKLRAEIQEQRAHGRVEALKTSVKLTKRFYDAEEAKLKALQEHTEEEPTGEVDRHAPSRPVGTRPPNRIAAKRAAEKATKTDPSPSVEEEQQKPKRKKKASKKTS